MEWIALSLACCTANPSKNTSSFYSATILNHTVACSNTFFLEAGPSMTSQANSPHSSLLLGRANFTDFENSYKIDQNSYKDIFFEQRSPKIQLKSNRSDYKKSF